MGARHISLEAGPPEHVSPGTGVRSILLMGRVGAADHGPARPRLLQILREYGDHRNQHRPHRSLHAATPLKPLPEPVNLDQYRVRRPARVGGLIGEYHLVA